MKFSLVLLFTFLLSCASHRQSVSNEPYAHIFDDRVLQIVKESIDFHGGLERWNRLQTLSYSKDFDLLTEDGNVEKSFRQSHSYKYNPLEVVVQSVENNTEVVSCFTEGEYTRQIDGQVQTVRPDKIAKGINSSLYVVGMPFKLLDHGARLTYAGEQILNNNVVDVIRVAYDAEKHDSHSSSEPWEYYFDKTDRRIVGSRVTSLDHINLVENISYHRSNGILFNSERESYRINSNGKKLYMRAKYNYYNYKIALKK